MGNCTFSSDYADAVLTGGAGMTAIADYIHLALFLLFPLLFVAIGIYAWRHDGGLVLYLTSVIGLGLSLGPLSQDFGVYAWGPTFLLMIGFLGLLVYDQARYGFRL